LTDLSIGIYGFLLVIVMVLRPQGLWPEKRRKLELVEGAVAAEQTELSEPTAGSVV
jgi:branched-chain amino acid transport system permease protein